MIKLNEGGGFTTETTYVGHTHWPCPPARDDVASCEEAWQRWRQRSPVRKVREVEGEDDAG